MKARIDRDVLRKALRTVLPAVGKTNLAVLNGVRIETIDGDGLRLTASDLQLTITADIDAKVLKEGVVVAPARLLANFIDRCPDGGVALEVKRDRLNVTSGDASLDMHLLPVGEWPKVGPVDGDAVSLTAEHVDLIRRILPFVSTDEKNRLVYCGVSVDGNRAIATDSYRLACATLGDVDLPTAVLPSAALSAALKDAGGVEVTISDTKATFAHDAATWTTVLLEGEFADVMRLVPATPPTSLRFDSARLADAISLVSVLDDEGIMVKIHRDGDKATVWIDHTDMGHADDLVPCDGDFDQPIGFNGTYLMSLITAAGTDSIRLDIIDPLKPVVVRSDDLVLLIMPVRIA